MRLTDLIFYFFGLCPSSDFCNEAQQEQMLSLPEEGSRAGFRKIVIEQKLYDGQNPPRN